MLLIVTSKEDYTADFLILRLRNLGIDYCRLNTEDFPTEISIFLSFDQSDLRSSYFLVNNRKIYFDNIKSVWYRRPLPPVPALHINDGVARAFVVSESSHLLNAIWRILDCLWVSHPDALRIASSKPYQLLLAARIGFKTPQTTITNIEHEARDFVKDYSETIYKPMEYRQISRPDDPNIGLIFTNVLSEEDKGRLSEVVLAPVLLQNYIQKATELRVTVIGKKVFAVRIDSQQHKEGIHDWRRPSVKELQHSAFELPSEIESRCLQLLHLLNLNFGAIDLILTPEGEYIFLEINANGQWAWIEQLLPEIELSRALITLLMENQ